MDKIKTPKKGRRFFLKLTSFFGVSVNYALIQSLFSGCESDTMKSKEQMVDFDISTEQSLSEIGGSAKATFSDYNNGKPVVITHTNVNEFVVLTSVCTYEGCLINLPDQESGIIECPCCGSRYAAQDGSVLRGPTVAPLRRYASAYNSSSNMLTITF